MSTGFDPLYQWLGIPPEEQPPHHYRLLGVRPFEDNPDVIESAADRQMAYLRTFYGGPYVSYAQKLLNEVSAVRVCLLNREKKAEYDDWLRPQIMPPSAAPEPPLAFEPEVGGFQEMVGGASQYGPPRPRAGGKGQPWLGIALLLMAVVIGAGIIAFAIVKSKGTVSREGILVVQWPEDERLRGVLELDGRKIKLPPDGPIELRVSAGTRQVAFTRPGYEPYQLTMLVEPGGRSAVRPLWRELTDASEDPKTGKKGKDAFSPEEESEQPGRDGKSAAKGSKKLAAEKKSSDEEMESDANKDFADKMPAGPAGQASRLPVPDETAQKKARKTVPRALPDRVRRGNPNGGEAGPGQEAAPGGPAQSRRSGWALCAAGHRQGTCDRIGGRADGVLGRRGVGPARQGRRRRLEGADPGDLQQEGPNPGGS